MHIHAFLLLSSLSSSRWDLLLAPRYIPAYIYNHNCQVGHTIVPPSTQSEPDRIRARFAYTLVTLPKCPEVKFVLRHDLGFSTHGLRFSWVALSPLEYAQQLFAV